MTNDLNSKELELYRNRCERYPTNLGYKYELGVRLYKARDYTEAIHVLQQARGHEELKGSVPLYLGVCCEAIKQYKLALSHYEEALDHINQGELDRRQLALYRAGIVAMEHMKDYAKAEKHFSTLAAHDCAYKDVSDRLDKLRNLRAN